MSLSKRRRRGSWWMFGIRALGVIGLFAALLGGIGARATTGFSFRAMASDLWKNPTDIAEWTKDITDPVLRYSLWLLFIGLAAALVSLLLQLIGGIGRIAGRRNVVSVNATLQTLLCVVLLVGINWFSFDHYQRFDWTGRQFAKFGMRAPLEPSPRFSAKFTLPPGVAADLQKLKAPTSVIVYQRHKTFGQLSDKPDAYDYAAERKVVEKVQDLVRLFREFGPQFNVVVLDVEDEDYSKKLKALTKDNPDLAKAIESAPENSIFFHARRGNREAVQRLSFNDFYQLDKSASKTNNNLVLLPQGIESFARRVLAIEEKKPKIALASIHEYLTTEGIEEFSLAGVKKSLEQQGFEVVDVVLKKGWNEGEPVPAAYTLGESQLERLEEDLAEYDAVLMVNREELKAVSAILDKLKSKMTLEELNKELRQVLRGQRMTEEARRRNIINLEPQVEALREFMQLQERERGEVLKQLDQVPNQERLAEARRMADVKAKFSKLIGDADLVVVPRITLRNAVIGDRIPARLYRLDDAQTSAIKDFMKAGKPVLALFGPGNEPPDRRGPAPTGPDSMEALFAQLGILFGNQTVLFNSESKAFSQRRASLLATGTEVEIPSLYFEPPKSKTRNTLDTTTEANHKPNPIAQSMKIVAGAAGSTDKLEKLKLRHPRPIYFVPVRGPASTVAEFLYTDAESWNEADPFPTREKTPRYELTKPDDPKRDTRDEKRRGPFPIGIAIETTVPSEWRDEHRPLVAEAALLTAGATAEPETAPYLVSAQALMPTDQYKPADYEATKLRVAAIGHGGLFTGPTLSPAKEQLLLHTTNWLLSRDERLPHDDQPRWQYPRVQLSERRAKFWRYGTLFVMPAAFGMLGALVLLVRKYR